jgi:hypothetical protein
MCDSSTIPHAKLHKCHNVLSFHRVREAVEAKFMAIYHLNGEYNPADIMTKHPADLVTPSAVPLLPGGYS